MKSFDFQSGKKVAEEIDRRILNVSKEVFNKAPKNYMKFGRVTAVNGAFCTLNIDKAIYTNVPIYKHVGAVSVGDVVDCIVPNGNMNYIRVVGIADGTIGGAGSTVTIRRWS